MQQIRAKSQKLSKILRFENFENLRFCLNCFTKNKITGSIFNTQGSTFGEFIQNVIHIHISYLRPYLKPYLRYISSITQVHHFQISISIASQPFSCLFIFRKRQKVSIQSNHVFKITSCLFSCQTHQQLRLRLVYH